MNIVKTLALLSLLTGILVLASYLIIGSLLGAFIGLGIAAIANLVAWFYSHQIALSVYNAQPLSREQAQKIEPMVKKLCARALLPLPSLYLIPSQVANAFATGRNPKCAAVALTQGIIDTLPDRELEAVIAHELSHIKNYNTLTQTVAATIAGAITQLAQLMYYGPWTLGGLGRTKNVFNPLGVFFGVLLAPVAAAVIRMSISRTREFAADAGAAQLTGNPQNLASALERLEQNSRQQTAQSIPAFAPLFIINPYLSEDLLNRLFATHPPIPSRVKQLNSRSWANKNLFFSSNKMKLTVRTRTIISTVIILAALGLTFAPLPALEQNIIVVSGTELQKPLQVLATEFERVNPQIKIDLKFQGSQDIVNRYIDRKNDFNPTILIPAEGEILQELRERYSAQENSEAFYDTPQPIAKTMLVGIAWQERGQILFPDGRFQWQNLEKAMQQRNWATIGGQANWGSFDLAISDPTRSNSGQLTLSLWAQSVNNSLNDPAVDSLFSLIKRSVYQPPRSTDILLQEFISRGANDADVATVYESIALYRWSQAQATQGMPYQIYYLDPTIETIATAAIARRNVDKKTAEAAKHFLNFITQPEQQQVLIRYGFRPVVGNIDLRSVPNSPWTQNIPGAEINPSSKILPPPNTQVRGEIQRLWQRAN